MGSCQRLWNCGVSLLEPRTRNPFLSRPVNRQRSEMSVELIPEDAEMQSQLAQLRSRVQLP
jgi:hypothetical protein